MLFGSEKILDGPTHRLLKNDRKLATIIMALFYTPLGTF
jgi:hypothetical protein